VAICHDHEAVWYALFTQGWPTSQRPGNNFLAVLPQRATSYTWAHIDKSLHLYCALVVAKLIILSLNPALYETCYLAHDIAQCLYATIPGKLFARTACSRYVHSSALASPFVLPFLRLYLPAQAHTCEHASREGDRLCMFLVQTTKHTSLQHGN